MIKKIWYYLKWGFNYSWTMSWNFNQECEDVCSQFIAHYRNGYKVQIHPTWDCVAICHDLGIWIRNKWYGLAAYTYRLEYGTYYEITKAKRSRPSYKTLLELAEILKKERILG